MNQSELKQLIELSKRNDHKAFRKIVEQYQQMIYSLSFRLLCEEEDAKDIVQETFIKIWLNLSKYNTEKEFSTWAYTIATNLCLDKLKSKKNKTQVIPIDDNLFQIISTEDIEDKLTNNQLSEIIHKLTEELTPKQKIVFTLCYLENIEVAEIVQITGLTPEKIKSNLYLAKQTILNKLEKHQLS